MPIRKPTAVLTAVLIALAGVAPVRAAGTDTPTVVEESPLAQAKKLVDAKDYGAAVPLLRKIVAAEPGNANAFNWLGYSLRKGGDFAAAETAYGKALAIDPAHKGALEYLGELYVETKRPEKARELLARLQAVCPGGCEELDDFKKALGAGN
jgi:Flp pilus assembly protein TadD